MDFFLSATVPDMKVLRMLPTLRSDAEPSMPAMEPLTMPPTELLMLPNNWLMAELHRNITEILTTLSSFMTPPASHIVRTGFALKKNPEFCQKFPRLK
jgi:hypothetical protein